MSGVTAKPHSCSVMASFWALEECLLSYLHLHPAAEAGIAQAGSLSIRANARGFVLVFFAQHSEIMSRKPTCCSGEPQCAMKMPREKLWQSRLVFSAFHSSAQLSSHTGTDLPLRIPDLCLAFASSTELHHSRTSFLFKFHLPLCFSRHSTCCPVYLGVGSILSSADKLPWFTTANRLEKGREGLSVNAAQSLVECVQTGMKVSLPLNFFTVAFYCEVQDETKH